MLFFHAKEVNVNDTDTINFLQVAVMTKEMICKNENYNLC